MNRLVGVVQAIQACWSAARRSRPQRMRASFPQSAIHFGARPVGHRASIYFAVNSDRSIFTIVDCGNPATAPGGCCRAPNCADRRYSERRPQARAGSGRDGGPPCPRIADYRSPCAARTAASMGGFRCGGSCLRGATATGRWGCNNKNPGESGVVVLIAADDQTASHLKKKKPRRGGGVA